MISYEELEQKYCDNLIDCFDFNPSKGWLSIIDSMFSELKLEDEFFSVAQIKSKFGNLRCYLNYTNKEKDKIVDFYTKICNNSCEHC